MIELVTFDFWQTLMADTPEGNRANEAVRLERIGRLLESAGHPVSPAALEAAHAASWARLAGIWATHRDVPMTEQVRVFLACADPALPERLPPAILPEIVEAYTTAVLHHPPALAAGAREAIAALRARGLTLGLISNTGRTPGTVLRRLLARHGLLDAFRVLSFSDEVGYRKPHAEIFRATLARAGGRPETAVHVGDDPEADVAGARAVGMRALLYVADGRRAPPGQHEGILYRFADLPAVLGRLA